MISTHTEIRNAERTRRGADVRSAAFLALLVATLFNALSAVAGGIAILATGGLGMPADFLATSPFASFTVPALILLLVVGGTQALAGVLLIIRRESGLLWAAVAGFGILIWIFVETGLIRGWSWLQALYFVTGTAQLVLVFAMLGIVSWLPRVPLSDRIRVSRQGNTDQRRSRS